MTEEKPIEHPQTNKHTKAFIITISVLIALFIALTLFFMTRPQAIERETIQYNYYNFTEEAGMWKTKLKRGQQEYEIILRFNPEQAEEIELEGRIDEGFFKPPIYITFDPDANGEDMKYLALGAAELSLNVVRALGLEVQAACTKNLTETCAERPIMTCNNTNESIIYIKAAEEDKVIMDGRCITLQGKNFGLLKSVDRLLYHWYGIINPLDEEYEKVFEQAIERYKNQTDQAYGNES